MAVEVVAVVSFLQDGMWAVRGQGPRSLPRLVFPAAGRTPWAGCGWGWLGVWEDQEWLSAGGKRGGGSEASRAGQAREQLEM